MPTLSDGRQTVLVVDDDPDIAEALTDALSDEGYPVVCTRDGLEALEYLRASPAPGLILLDWMMPRCDGATFVQHQQQDPALSGIPVVLVTADTRFHEKALTLNAVAYLTKPIRFERLLHLVAMHCGVAAESG
jgi:CheY-like chemotaxis protein